MAAWSPGQAFAHCLQLLRRPGEAERHQGCVGASAVLQRALVECTVDELTDLAHLVNQAIHELFVSGHQTAGLLLIDELVSVDYMEANLKVTRFANYLRGALPTEDPRRAELVAAALGKLAVDGGILAPEVMEAELRRSMEWLALVQSGHDPGNRRYSSVLIIDEIARRAPHVLANRLDAVLDHLPNGIRDQRVAVREAAVRLLQSLLRLLGERSKGTRELHYTRLLEAAALLTDEFPLDAPQPRGEALGEAGACYIGGYLLYAEVFRVANQPPRKQRSNILLARFAQVIGQCQQDIARRKQLPAGALPHVVAVLPVCAEFHPHAFSKLFLQGAATTLLDPRSHGDAEGRQCCLLALAQVLSHVGRVESDIALQHLPPLADALRRDLAAALETGAPGADRPVLQSIALLAEALPRGEISGLAVELISQVLVRGLSPAVCEVTGPVAAMLGEERRDELYGRALATIQGILDPSFEQPPKAGAGATKLRPQSRKGRPSSGTLPRIAVHTEGDVRLALGLLPGIARVAPRLVHQCGVLQERVTAYLTHWSAEVRGAAVRTAGELLEALLPQYLEHRFAEDVLRRVLGVAVADVEPRIRRGALRVLRPRFDQRLAQSAFVRLLCCACYDASHIDIRADALAVMRRLHRINPGVVATPLRRLLVSTLRELQLCQDLAAQHHAAEALGKVVAAAPQLARHYAVAVRDGLLAKLDKRFPVTLHTKVTGALEALADAAGSEAGCLDEALPHIVKSIEASKSSLQRRLGSLNCLAALLRATDFREHPYERFPRLVGLLLRILQAPQPNGRAETEVRLAVLRCLGVAGAYHRPYKQGSSTCKLLGEVPRTAASGLLQKDALRRGGPAGPEGGLSLLRRDAAQSVTVLLAGGGEHHWADCPALIPTSGEALINHLNHFYPEVATSVMLRVLADQGLASNHRMAIGAIVTIFKVLDNTERPVFVPRVFPTLISILERSRSGGGDPGFVSFQVQQLRILTQLCGCWARPHLGALVGAVAHLFEVRDAQGAEARLDVLHQAVALVADLRLLFREDFRAHVGRVVPLLVHALSAPHARGSVAMKALHAVHVLGPQLDGFLTIIVPLVIDCFGDSAVLARIAAVSASAKAPQQQQPQQQQPPARSEESGRGGQWPSQTGIAMSPTRDPPVGLARSPSLDAGAIPRTPSLGALSLDAQSAGGLDRGYGGAGGVQHDAVFVSAVRALQCFAQLSAVLSLREFAVPFMHACARALSCDELGLPTTPTPPNPARGEQPPQRGKGDGTHLRSGTGGGGALRSPLSACSQQGGSFEDAWRKDLASGVQPLRVFETEVVAALCDALPNLHPEARVAESMLSRLIAAKGLETDAFRVAVQQERSHPSRAHAGANLWFSVGGAERTDSGPGAVRAGDLGLGDLTCNPTALQKVWAVSMHGSSAGEWTEWLRVFSLTLLRESPSPSLRACSSLAQVNLSVSRQLFNCAFVSCYLSLPQPHKRLLLKAVAVAIKSPSLPADVLQPLLSLAEFMEHMEVSTPHEAGRAQGRGAAPSQMGSPAQMLSEGRVESCRVAVSAPAALSAPCEEGSIDLTDPGSSGRQHGTPSGLLETTAEDVLRGRGAPEAKPQSAVASPAAAAGTPSRGEKGAFVAPPLPLPSEFDISVLAEKAERCQMYAKALHYRELLFVDHLKRQVGGLFGQYVDGYVVPFTPLRGRGGTELEEETWKQWVVHVQRIIRIHQNLSCRRSAPGILAFALANFERVVFFDGAYRPRVEAKMYEELHEWHAAREEWLMYLHALDGTCSVDQGSTRGYPPGSHPRDFHELLGMSPSAGTGLLPSHGRSLIVGPSASLDLGPPAEGLAGGSPPAAEGTSLSPTDNASLGTTSGSRGAFTPVEQGSRPAPPPLQGLPPRHEVVLGLVKTQTNLGEWHEVLRRGRPLLGGEHGADLAPWVAHAAWMLQDWDTMGKGTELMDPGEVRTQVHLSVLSLQGGDIEQARAAIQRARQLILPDLGPLAAESYQRAYPLIVKLQVLTELEEIAMWKERGGIESASADEVEHLLRMWTTRLRHTERRVSFWEVILAVRRVLVAPHMHMACWLKLVTTARKVGKLAVAENTLRQMLGTSEAASLSEAVAGIDPAAHDAVEPVLAGAVCEHIWHVATGGIEKRNAIFLLSEYIDRLCGATHSTKHSCTKGRYHRRLGEWMQELHPDTYWQPPHRDRILKTLRRATIHDPDSWKNWHRWALMNHRVMRRSMIRDYRLIPYILCSANGFMMSITKGSPSCIQDLLRLLGLWFAHGHIKQVEMDMRSHFLKSIPTEQWLSVIPQIVARLHHPTTTIRTLVHMLLVRVGKEHAQACMYPLLCVTASEDAQRARFGREVLDRIRVTHRTLVEQGEMVAQNLTNAALILAEHWWYGMDEARWFYWRQRDPNGMIRVLLALHKNMDRAPRSEHESAFIENFGDRLKQARQLILQAQQQLLSIEQRFGAVPTPGVAAQGQAASQEQQAVAAFNRKVEEAWQVYSQVGAEIEQRLTKLPTLDLSIANPDLISAKELIVAIPGSYSPTEPAVTIARFEPQCYIMHTKQRPRRITIWGSDGRDYSFLLKGREDLRQDERVMQLFRLTNQLLSDDHSTAQMPPIELYAVIPLASSAGLIGWLSNAQTVFQTIKEYRRGHRIPTNLEKNMLPNMVEIGGNPARVTQEYDKLMLYQKVDVFEYILERTDGDDISRMLWLKSRSSEVWLANRTTYTESLAVMSMVGFVLGLGDRHPSNLMLDRYTRKVIHIDFGDCFEVASRREKFPEKVPFRMTRMLIKAMDLAGVEGNFRRTSEHVMRVLRKHKDSLMSILSSFLHDPLINWRLLNADQQAPPIVALPPSTLAAQEAAARAGPREERPLEDSAAKQKHVTDALRHRSVREQVARSVLHHQDTGNAVKHHSIQALNRIRRKLDGLTFTMGGTTVSDTLYTYDYHDPLFVGECMAINAPPTLKDVICGECESEHAAIRCDDCKDVFCATCSDQIHMRRRNQYHTNITKIERDEDSLRSRLRQLDQVDKVLEVFAPEELARLAAVAVRIQSAMRGFLVRNRSRRPPGAGDASTDPEGGSDASPTASGTGGGRRTDSPRRDSCTDGGSSATLTPSEQVARLIREATAHENLAQAFFGWCPYW